MLRGLLFRFAPPLSSLFLSSRGGAHIDSNHDGASDQRAQPLPHFSSRKVKRLFRGRPTRSPAPFNAKISTTAGRAWPTATRTRRTTVINIARRA